MRYFPAFLDLKDRLCLVVGDGPVARRKAEMLARAGGRVRCVPVLAADDLAGVAAVVIANGDATAAALARRAGVPVNVVDRPKLGSFIMPALVERGPLTIAIGTGGAAPLLASLLRARIDSLVPAAYGQLAALAQSCRVLVRERLPDPAARRAFWQRAFTGRIADLVFAGRPAAARQALRTALHASGGAPPFGHVALVGAGPGDPELLTLKALRLLQEADVVVHDRLVGNGVLQLARRDAERIDVGKARERHTLPQPEINALLVRLARAGKRVVRLKGGDPFVFGRGGEELQALAAAGVRFEVVPGITAACGVTAYAGIPLTHRDCAQSCTFVTGHLKDGSCNLDWPALARPRQTVVIYMGLAGLPTICAQLAAHGLGADWPAAVIGSGTLAQQRVVAGTLGTLPALVADAALTAPCLTIVGEVVRLRDELAWFASAPRVHAEVAPLR
ncbi:MAG: siroheme synthase CysG [Alphaproteobacteria bacterium]|nr:siroheme synthase CysG [Alphaproteobacteria bacterium]